MSRSGLVFRFLVASVLAGAALRPADASAAPAELSGEMKACSSCSSDLSGYHYVENDCCVPGSDGCVEVSGYGGHDGPGYCSVHDDCTPN